jgi:hypothetical protein
MVTLRREFTSEQSPTGQSLARWESKSRSLPMKAGDRVDDDQAHVPPEAILDE